MRSPIATRSWRRRALSAGLILLLVAGACSPAPPADGPGSVVNAALAKVAAKDLTGLRTLACSGQEDLIRAQLGLPGAVGEDLLPGVDVAALLDAVNLDVSRVTLGEPVIDGDVAQVPVGGDVKVTFDADALRPILRRMLDQQGVKRSDEQLDALLKTFQASGQDVPLDQSVRLVRENGAWKICQGTPASTPGAS
jgi:hypothetical protein